MDSHKFNLKDFITQESANNDLRKQGANPAINTLMSVSDDELQDTEEVTCHKKYLFVDTGLSAIEVELPEITDDSGRLSDAVSAIMQQTGLSVIPFSALQLSPSVATLRDYTVREYLGEKFALSTSVRQSVIEQYKERIVKVLSVGSQFRESLWIQFSYNGKEYKTLALSEIEYSTLCKMFSTKHPEVYQTDDGNIFLSFSLYK